MDDKIMNAILANANIKIVLAPDDDAGMRKLAAEAMNSLIGPEVAPSYDPVLEPMRALARAADRLGVLIECDNEDHNGAGADDVAAYDGLLRVLARWQATYGDASKVNPKQAADDVALALHGAIARVEIAHQEGSDIMKAALPDMKAALAAYYRMRADSEIGMLRSPKSEQLEAALAEAQQRAAFFENELQEARRDLASWDGTTEAIQSIRDNIVLCLAGGTNGGFGSGYAVGTLPKLRVVMNALDRMAQGEDVQVVIEETGCTAALNEVLHAANLLTNDISVPNATQPAVALDGPSSAKASECLQLMKDTVASMEGVLMGDVRNDFAGGWIGAIRFADGTQVLANYSAHGRIDLGIKPTSGPFQVAIIRQVDLAQRPSVEDLRSHLQATADILAAARAPQCKLLAHAAITHDTLSELAENGELPSAIQSRVADHLEEGTALFRAAGIECEPAPITADSLRM